MLLTLEVRNLVLIDTLELRLEPGFNVITGETGAGKSILVGALSLVLGGRGRADLVRPGAKEAEVHALFDVSACAPLRQQLEAAGIPCDEELVVRRVLQAGGRSRAYLNGRLCSLAELSEIGKALADVTSQHESVALVDPRLHLEHLDRYGDLTDERERLAGIVDELTLLQGELETLAEQERGRAEREAFLRYQLDAIDKLDPQPDELEQLGAERNRLRHADRITSACAEVAHGLEGRDGDGGLCDVLGRLLAEVGAVVELDPGLESLRSELEDCWTRLGEVGREAGRYAERLEWDPERFAEVQERLHQLGELLRRHGPTLTDVDDARGQLVAELEILAGGETRSVELQGRRDELMGRASKLAKSLSDRRRAVASDLGAAVSAELCELGMGSARVVVEVSESCGGSGLAVAGARLTRTGIDHVQFLIAPNRGLEPRPLGRIASGGELSRALLALKRVLSRTELDTEGERAVGVQVFDEVDSGVGGETADKIGRAMASIASHRQVLCITHLASIAAHADAHFVVAKHDAEVACTTVQRLEGDERVAELARMLTGKSRGSTEKAAAELLTAAHACRDEGLGLRRWPTKKGRQPKARRAAPAAKLTARRHSRQGLG